MLFVNPTTQVPRTSTVDGMDILTHADDPDSNAKILAEPWTTSSTEMDVHGMDVAFDVHSTYASTLESGQLQQHQMAVADEVVVPSGTRTPAPRDKGVYLLEVATERTPTHLELRGSSASSIKKRARVPFPKDGSASDVHNLLCGAFPDLQHQE